jgi:DivIVA domain-containing protein
MEWFIAVVVVAALGVAAVAAAGGLGEMAKEPVRDVYRQDLPGDRPLGAGDIQRLKFGVTLRGYAMAQVDDVLDRLAAEIAERDDLIARLTADPGPVPSSPPADASDEADGLPAEPPAVVESERRP